MKWIFLAITVVLNGTVSSTSLLAWSQSEWNWYFSFCFSIWSDMVSPPANLCRPENRKHLLGNVWQQARLGVALTEVFQSLSVCRWKMLGNILLAGSGPALVFLHLKDVSQYECILRLWLLSKGDVPQSDVGITGEDEPMHSCHAWPVEITCCAFGAHPNWVKSALNCVFAALEGAATRVCLKLAQDQLSQIVSDRLF